MVRKNPLNTFILIICNFLDEDIVIGLYEPNDIQ